MSALAERTNGRLAVVQEPRKLDAHGRLEALCDPGSLNVIRSTVLPRRESNFEGLVQSAVKTSCTTSSAEAGSPRTRRAAENASWRWVV